MRHATASCTIERMYQPLAPCPACSRHVKTSERTCPFCDGALPDGIADAAMPGASSRLSRAAAFAFSASIAVTGAAAASLGCTTGTDPNPGDASSDASPTDARPDDSGGQQPVYGAPAFDAGPDDSGGGGAKYGGPPIDSGK